MEPIRIKVHGLVWLTKRRYLALQAVAALGALALLGVWAYLRTVSAEAEDYALAARVALAVRDWIPWIVAALLAAVAIETCVVLRRFAEEERTKRAVTAP